MINNKELQEIIFLIEKKYKTQLGIFNIEYMQPVITLFFEEEMLLQDIPMVLETDIENYILVWNFEYCEYHKKKYTQYGYYDIVKCEKQYVEVIKYLIENKKDICAENGYYDLHIRDDCRISVNFNTIPVREVPKIIKLKNNKLFFEMIREDASWWGNYDSSKGFCKDYANLAVYRLIDNKRC